MARARQAHARGAVSCRCLRRNRGGALSARCGVGLRKQRGEVLFTEEILDQATAARSIAELKIEIGTLKQLESLALGVCRSGTDTKWRELASLLNEVFTSARAPDSLAETTTIPRGSGTIPPPKPSPHQVPGKPGRIVDRHLRASGDLLDDRCPPLGDGVGGRV
jgi:hypothetical protein